MLGSDGVCQSIFTLWVTQKLRRIIALHIGLVTFNFPKNVQCPHFHICGPNGHVHDPQTPLFLTLDPPNYSKIQDNPKSFLETIIFGNLRTPEIDFVGKSVCDISVFLVPKFENNVSRLAGNCLFCLLDHKTQVLVSLFCICTHTYVCAYTCVCICTYR